jgi:hypothetical protein
MASGVSAGALKRLKWRMRRTRQRTGHNSGLPLRPRPMTSPQTPFFCVVKVREAKVPDHRDCSPAVAGSIRTGQIKNWTSHIRKGVVSEAVAVYSPGRSKKKKASPIISATARLFIVAERSAAVSMCPMIAMGIGLTRSEEGLLWNSRQVSAVGGSRCRRKSMLPWMVNRGSWDPILANVWPTLRRALYTVRERTDC